MLRYVFCFCVTFCVAALLFASCSARANEVDWSNAFRFSTSGGFENPALLVAFNPQPEPPAITHAPEIDLLEPTQLKMTLPDLSNSEGGARILFAVPEGFEIKAGGLPTNQFVFQTIGQGVQDVRIDFSTDSGAFVSPGSWVAFNPQPEPPAGWAAIGFDFELPLLLPATITIQIMDDSVAPLEFNLIQAADFNQDNTVDADDLSLWENSFGVDAGGDANLDGQTRGDDFLVWQRQHSTVVTSISAVPEPAGGTLAITFVLAATLLRHRFA